MTENTDNLVLDILRAIRQDVGDIKEEVIEIKSRLTSLENRVSIMQKTLDRHDVRFARIETRLNLVEA